MGDTRKRLIGPDRLPPMIGMYFGGKRRLGPKYPTPEHREIVEPFAGGAGYSLCHWRHDVTLYEKSEHVCAVWDFLIGAEPSDILALPVVEPGERVSEMGLPIGAEYLIRGWLAAWEGRGRKPHRLVAQGMARCAHRVLGRQVPSAHRRPC